MPRHRQETPTEVELEILQVLWELRADRSKVLILVGQSNLTKGYGVVTKTWEPETFVVKCNRNVLILAGEDGGGKKNARKGTLWAVYDFLQDQLGCRWIWPGETGRRVPRRKTGTMDSYSAAALRIGRITVGSWIRSWW